MSVEQILAMIAKRDALARHMLKAIGELGRSPTARIDARAWLSSAVRSETRTSRLALRSRSAFSLR